MMPVPRDIHFDANVTGGERPHHAGSHVQLYALALVHNRTVIIAFQFVPLWLGVDEAGTGLVTTALHLGATAGIGLALIRKARVVVWTGLGLGLFFLPRSWARMSHLQLQRCARSR